MIKLQDLLTKYGNDISFVSDVLQCNAVCENDSITITYRPGEPITDSYTDRDKNVVDYTLDLNNKLNPDAQVELVCYWYYGALPKNVHENIHQAFDTHDYAKLQRISSESFDKAYAWCIPQTISLTIDGNILGHINYIDNFLFEHLDHQECEHG